MKTAIRYFFGWKCIVIIFALVGTYIIPFSDKFTLIRTLGRDIPYHILVWGNFDGYHYITIARNGYGLHQHPFMPLYPLAIRMVSRIIRINLLYSALILSNLSFFLALLVVFKLLKVDGYRRLTPYVFFAIILFPTSLFYQAAYNDALFFLLATWCLLAARMRNYYRAALLGMLATLTRINGLALFPFLVTEYVLSDGTGPAKFWQLQTIKTHVVSVCRKIRYTARVFTSFLLVPLGFLGYLLYTHIRFGSWQLVFTSMRVWHQDKIIFPLQTVWRYIKIFTVISPYTFEYWVAIFECTAVLLYTLLLVYSFKRIRLSYWIFFACSILIPSLTGTFQGMPRYGLYLYPMFLSLGFYMNTMPRWVKILLMTSGVLLLAFYTVFFTRGYFVA